MAVACQREHFRNKVRLLASPTIQYTREALQGCKCHSPAPPTPTQCPLWLIDCNAWEEDDYSLIYYRASSLLPSCPAQPRYCPPSHVPNPHSLPPSLSLPCPALPCPVLAPPHLNPSHSFLPSLDPPRPAPLHPAYPRPMAGRDCRPITAARIAPPYKRVQQAINPSIRFYGNGKENMQLHFSGSHLYSWQAKAFILQRIMCM